MYKEVVVKLSSRAFVLVWFVLIFHGLRHESMVGCLNLCAKEKETGTPKPYTVYYRDNFYNAIPTKLHLNATVHFNKDDASAHIEEKPRVPEGLLKCKNAIGGSQSSEHMFQVQSSKLRRCSCEPITLEVEVLQFKTCMNRSEDWKIEMVPVTIAFNCIEQLPHHSQDSSERAQVSVQ
jgi:hypothetical protein